MQLSRHSVVPVSFLMRAGRLKRWREGRGRSFYPPLDSRFAVRLAWMFLNRILWSAARISELDFENDDRLTRLRGQRAIIAPNHPTNLDPLALFALSRRVDERFNFLASRESFSVPGIGYLLQLCGAYSIMRGTVDRMAIKTTRRLLVEGRKIVMFPEGLTYGQNETLMPFHEGVVQFGYWAMEDLSKAGIEEPIWLVPVGLRYRYLKPMDREIETSIQRLEEHVGLDPGDKPVYERLRAIGESVVAGYEAAYNVKPNKEHSLDDRIVKMKEIWVSRAASATGIQDDVNASLGDRIRTVVNGLDRMTIAEDASEFTKQTMRRRHSETLPLYKDLERAARFLATGAKYVANRPTDERFLEVISQIEEELFGFSAPYGPRRVVITFGEPIDLRTWRTDYASEPRKTVTSVTRELESRVGELLNLDHSERS